MPSLTDKSREAIADILKIVAEEGLKGPRDLDVALDAIEESIDIDYQNKSTPTILDSVIR